MEKHTRDIENTRQDAAWKALDIIEIDHLKGGKVDSHATHTD
jgi:hypothetical protein